MRDFVRAAKADSAVAALKTKDQRNQIIQDAALSYTELTKWELRLARLQETEAAANKMQTSVTERVKEGIDSELDGTRARLSVARIHLRIAEAQGAADVLREHLSKLTGLPAANIQTDPDSIPAPPAAGNQAGPNKTANEAATSSLSVEAAVEHAAHNTCELGENTDLFGPASISPRNTPCSQDSTTFRTTTSLPGPAPLPSANSCASPAASSRTTQP